MSYIMPCSTIKVQWEYEDELDIDITDGMFRASEVDNANIKHYPHYANMVSEGNGLKKEENI